MGRIEWENAKTRLDALLVIDEYRTDPNETWLRLIVKTEGSYGVRYLIDNGSGDSLDVMFTDKMKNFYKKILTLKGNVLVTIC